MSGSPKYSEPSLDDDVEKGIDDDYEAKAAAEAEARRIAHEETMREWLRNEISGESNKLARRISLVRGITDAQWLVAALDAEQERCQNLVTTFRSLSSVEQLEDARYWLSVIANQVAVYEHRANAEVLAERLRREYAEKLERVRSLMSAVQASVAKVSATLRIRFDPKGAREIDQRLALATQMCADDRLDEAEKLLNALIVDVSAHSSKVVCEYQRAKMDAEAHYARCSSILDGLVRDKTVPKWSKVRLDAIRNSLTQMHDALKEDDFDRTMQVAKIVDGDASLAVSEAQARQLLENRRDYIVEGIRKTLMSQGFQVSKPALSRVDDWESEFVIHASREGGRVSLETKIPVEGAVAYDVKGMKRHQQLGKGGGVILVCDDTEAMLAHLHRALAKIGIKMGDLYWKGKDPRRIGRVENELPTGAPRVSRGKGQ